MYFFWTYNLQGMKITIAAMSFFERKCNNFLKNYDVGQKYQKNAHLGAFLKKNFKIMSLEREFLFFYGFSKLQILKQPLYLNPKLELKGHSAHSLWKCTPFITNNISMYTIAFVQFNYVLYMYCTQTHTYVLLK